MSEFDPAVPRRTVLKSAGLGVSAGLLSSLPVAAQTASGGEIWSAEYWAKKGDVKLISWRKRHRCAEIGRSGAARAVSGAWLLGLVAFFLRSHCAGQGRIFDDERVRSRGYDVWTMDHDGYGYSGQLRQQFRHPQRRRRFESRCSGGCAGDRPAKVAFLRDIIWRYPRRRLRAGAARAGRPAGTLRLHLQG